jgi:hypothetical protein
MRKADTPQFRNQPSRFKLHDGFLFASMPKTISSPLFKIARVLDLSARRVELLVSLRSRWPGFHDYYNQGLSAIPGL